MLKTIGFLNFRAILYDVKSWPARFFLVLTEHPVCQCQQNCLNFEFISASMIRWGILHDNQYKIVIRCHKDFVSSGGNPQIKQFISRIHRLYRSFGSFRKVGYQPRILKNSKNFNVWIFRPFLQFWSKTDLLSWPARAKYNWKLLGYFPSQCKKLLWFDGKYCSIVNFLYLPVSMEGQLLIWGNKTSNYGTFEKSS